MSEAFYDEEIARVLLELARKCEDNGLSFLALVEYAPGKVGQTLTEQADSDVGFRMASMAARANGNADSLIWALRRHGKKHGHNSVCLELMDRWEAPDAQR